MENLHTFVTELCVLLPILRYSETREECRRYIVLKCPQRNRIHRSWHRLLLLFHTENYTLSWNGAAYYWYNVYAYTTHSNQPYGVNDNHVSRILSKAN